MQNGFILHTEICMPTLQVRNLPEDVYIQLNYLAEREHRNLAQEAIVLLKEGMDTKLGNKERRKRLLEKIKALDIDGSNATDPIFFIREDRDR